MIDASIPLQTRGLKPPPDPMEGYSQALAIANALQQNRAGNLQLQQQEEEMADQQKLKQAYAEAKGDLKLTEENAMRLGVRPQTIIRIKQSVLDQATKQAELDEKTDKLAKERNGYASGQLLGVLQSPEAERPIRWGRTRQEAIQKGYFKPEELPEQYPGDEGVNELLSKVNTGAQILSIADSIRKAKFEQAEETRKATEETRKAEEFGIKKPEMQAKAAQARRSELAARLGAAKDQAEYRRILGESPFELARDFADKTPEQARRMGMDANQQQQAVQSDRTATEAQRRDAEAMRHNRVIEAQAEERLRKDPMLKTAPDSVIQRIVVNESLINTIDGALKELESHPDAVGLKNFLGDTVRSRTDPEGVNARAAIANVGGQKFHDLSGAAVSVSEANRLKPFIPLTTDSTETAIKKLKRMKVEAEDVNTRTRESYADGYKPIGGNKPEAATPAAPGGKVPTITNQAEYDKLPVGAEFIEDGVRHRKVAK